MRVMLFLWKNSGCRTLNKHLNLSWRRRLIPSCLVLIYGRDHAKVRTSGIKQGQRLNVSRHSYQSPICLRESYTSSNITLYGGALNHGIHSSYFKGMLKEPIPTRTVFTQTSTYASGILSLKIL